MDATLLHLDADTLRMKHGQEEVSIALTPEQAGSVRGFMERHHYRRHGLDIGFRVLKLVDPDGTTQTDPIHPERDRGECPSSDPDLDAVFGAMQLLGFELDEPVDGPVGMPGASRAYRVGVGGRLALVVFGDAPWEAAIGEDAQNARHVVIVLTRPATVETNRRLRAVSLALSTLPEGPKLHVLRPEVMFDLALEARRTEDCRLLLRMLSEIVEFKTINDRAIVDMILRSAENCRRFLDRDYDQIRYGDYRYAGKAKSGAKKGKPVSCMAWMAGRVVSYRRLEG